MKVRRPDGVEIAVETEGTGPAVLLVHGLGFSSRGWRPHVDALVAAGFRTVTLDLRGFGASDAAPEAYDVETLAADVEAVREAVGLDDFHLVGHSLGGMVALEYAVEQPHRVRSLVCASTTSHNGRRASLLARVMTKICAMGFDAGMADPKVAADVEELCASLAILLPALKGPMRRGAETPHRGKSMAWQAIVGFSVRDRVSTLQCPTLVIHGEDDLLIPCITGALIAAGIPGARWVQIAGAGHGLPLQRLDVFQSHVLEFLRQVETS